VTRRDLSALFARLHGADEADARAAARELAGRGDVVVVSACLLGERVRYDGRDRRDPDVEARIAGRVVLPLCPEVLGGMGCPRPPVHFAAGDGEALLYGGGQARDDRGRDAGPALRRGAARASELTRLAGANRAILKQRSPSCGTREVHGPAGVVAGRGAFAAALSQQGVALFDEDGRAT
jgi:uncharacterized protein YbbK (DUF523 family)